MTTIPVLPGSQRLAEAGLRAEQSAADGLCHLVDGDRLDARLTAVATGRATAPRIHALCRVPVLIGSLTAEPGPACLHCLETAGAYLAVAARHRAVRERAARPAALVTRVAEQLGARRVIRTRGAGRHRDSATMRAVPASPLRGGVCRTERPAGRHRA